MTRRSVNEQQQQDFHRFMLEDVERLDSLINHLLDAARIERGIEPADDEALRLDELLSQCGSAVCMRYRLSSETVELRSPEMTIRSQWIQLEILFRNLIDNAVKYGGSPPAVVVTVTPEADNKVKILIADNGAGIPANQRRKVFGRFVRLGSELERSTPGTGLGLYLVRTAAKAIGGSVRVNDRKNDSGTEFEVILGGVVDAP
jgi:signal transduction histidine kinase